jgi:hypothetical protein
MCGTWQHRVATRRCAHRGGLVVQACAQRSLLRSTVPPSTRRQVVQAPPIKLRLDSGAQSSR